MSLGHINHNQKTMNLIIHQLRTLIILFFLLPYLMVAQSQDKEKTTKRKVYTTSTFSGDAPTIDGDVSDKAWNAVPWTSNYTEFEPDNGTPPSEQTKMKITYDSKNLYVAFLCYEKDPSKIEKRLGRRDDFPGDWVEINIDSYNDDRSGFSFTASASGVKGCLLYTSPSPRD